MTSNRIKFNQIVADQFPTYIREEFPAVQEFFTKYYLSQEYPGGVLDILNNIDKYSKIEEISDRYVDDAELTQPVGIFDTEINVASTKGFPDNYGLIKIDDELILYTEKTKIQFKGCVRGFLGITSYDNPVNIENFIFSDSTQVKHELTYSPQGVGLKRVTNLSSLFLKEFFNRAKYRLAPGFENRELFSGLDEATSKEIAVKPSRFIKQIKDFYKTRGTDESFKILFKALYGENAEVVRPREFLFRPSDSQFQVTRDFVVTPISGNPSELERNTLQQDAYKNITKAYAPVAKVEKITTGLTTSNYWKISIDADYNRDILVEGSIYGNFTAHAKTKTIGSISKDSSSIDVDSTVGFPQDGELYVTYSNGTVGVVSYTDKSLTQFSGCTNVTETIKDAETIFINSFAYGYSNVDQSLIKVRITPVLENPTESQDNHYYESGELIDIKSLGEDKKNKEVWIVNSCPTYNVKSLSLTDSQQKLYSFSTFDEILLKVGDTVSVEDTTGSTTDAEVFDITSSNTLTLRADSLLDVNKKYTFTKKLSKVNATYFTGIDDLNSNVDNLYTDGVNTLVASSSLPTYKNQPLNAPSRKIEFSGTFPPVGVGSTNVYNISPLKDHGLYTGDAVFYSFPIKEEYDIFSGNTVTTFPEGNLGTNYEKGLYFVKRIDENNVQFAKGRSDLYHGNFVSTPTPVTITGQVIDLYKFKDKTLSSQKLIREIAPPEKDGVSYKTIPGSKTGIFANGVELQNYKSTDTVYYGPIQKIEVSSPGENYDVINPPILHIDDSVGTGATGYVSVSGSLQQIDIISPGFNYIETPIIRIVGGNGKDAQAVAKLNQITHSVDFNSTVLAQRVGLGTTVSTIGFTTYHKFTNAEKVLYKNNGEQVISGLSTNSNYYVGVVDAYTVKLYPTENQAVLGVGTVTLLDYGTGNHTLESVAKKNVISKINVISNGEGYTNRKLTTGVIGINTADNCITIPDHKFSSGEKIVYNVEGTTVLGLTPNTNYYIDKKDNNSFRLFQSGIGSDGQVYNTKTYADLKNVGVGTHIFNYPEIEVIVEGKIGISSLSTEDFKARVQPIFRGEVQSIHLSNTGVGYGSSEIINFNREPLIELQTGTGAQLTPIVNNGQLVEVLVNNKGSGYNAPPELRIDGAGIGAVITPVIVNGEIESVNIIQGGVDYTREDTFINVIPSGQEAKFSTVIKTWTVNNVVRNYELFTADDGFITNGTNSEYGLQYTHLYAPRPLRKTLFGTDSNGNKVYGSADLKVNNGFEIDSSYHSPIIGYAYDGNPIYGPFGYSTLVGGVIRQVKSGYRLNIANDRPPFPEGFFAEDFTFYPSSDPLTLDENNGRYCVTPEYPNGIYAYFATLSETPDSTGIYKGFKSPVFPYIVGNYYNNVPNNYNFKSLSNQDRVDLNETDYVRITSTHKIKGNASSYKYVDIPNNLSQKTEIKFASTGSIDGVGIITGGRNYKVGDRPIIDFARSGGYGTLLEVDRVSGKDITNISAATSSISNIEFLPESQGGSFLAIAPNPHYWTNTDRVVISGLSTTNTLLAGAYRAGIATDKYVLTVGVDTSGVTGIVTYFNIFGNLDYPSLKENDILSIGTEEVKVLSVDYDTSRVKVLRSQNGTVSTAHTSTTVIRQNQRKFKINVGYKTTFNYKINKEFYFNPADSLSLGVGIGTTIVFSNPGAGDTNIFVPQRSVYLPNHGLKTGDILLYSTNTGDPIEVSVGGVSADYTVSDQETFYVAKISNDLIGIATVKVGLGSTGSFVGAGDSIRTSSTLYFTGIGTGVYHSFQTQYENVVTGSAEKNEVTVSLANTHGLFNGETVFVDVNVGGSKTVTVKYNDKSRRIVIDSKSFTSSGVSTSTSQINIANHGFKAGDKVLHTATVDGYGPIDGELYYVIFIDDNNIKLSETRSGALNSIPSYVGITSSYSGEIGLVNPPIEAYEDSTLVFDVSDSSLRFLQQSTEYSAFEMLFHSDLSFDSVFESSGTSNEFEVSRTGEIGISSNAKVELKINKNIPKVLYYEFSPTNTSILPNEKSTIIKDDGVIGYNEIIRNKSLYSGEYTAIVSAGTSFKYTIDKSPESTSYDRSSSVLNYSTNSRNAYGPVKSISIKNKGNKFTKLPGLSTTFDTDLGSDAIISVSGSNIGKIVSKSIIDIGYDLPTDKTLRPKAKLPQICTVETLSSLERVSVTSFGRGYTSAPQLILIDGSRKEVLPEADLRFELGNVGVEILNNTFALSPINPTIIPIHNSNGVGISSLTFDSTSQTVTATLSVGFSTAESFPFDVGDEVFVENASVTGATGNIKGFNSNEYNFNFFEVTQVSKNIGGIGIVTYSMSNVLDDNGDVADFDDANSAVRIIPRKHMPEFDIVVNSNSFAIGEEASFGDGYEGIIEGYNQDANILKLRSQNEVSVGDVITAKSTRTKATIKEVSNYDGFYQLSSSSIKKGGWENNAGFLGDNSTRLQDNDYYQNFSYSIKSRVPLETWDDAVSTLNHTTGFKKFSDLQIESKLGYVSSQDMAIGLPAPNDIPGIQIIVDLIGSGDLNCVYDFDLVKENSFTIDGRVVSDEIIFQNAVLTDYSESIGNRVLIIDDVSYLFNSNPRPTRFSEIARFNLADARVKKFITYAKDIRFTGERQVLLVTLLYDNDNLAYMNQYGRVESVSDLGSFDFSISGTEGVLNFYPVKYSVNDYSVSTLTIGINGSYVAGLGTTTLGDGVRIVGASKSDTVSSIVEIPSYYSSVKGIVEVTGHNGEYEYNEFNLTHNGTEIEFIDYGQLSNHSYDTFSGTGLGTFWPYISGSTLKVDFTSNLGLSTTGFGATVNTWFVALADTDYSGVGSTSLRYGKLKSSYVAISSSSSPTSHIVSDYINLYDGGYFLVQASDPDSGDHQFSEVVAVDDDNDGFITEFAVLETNQNLGTVGIAKTNDITKITFEPVADRNIQVKVFSHLVRPTNDSGTDISLDFNNSSVNSFQGTYEGTLSNIKRDFPLNHNNLPIFRREVDCSSSTNVNVSNNSIQIPDHYFVSGEEVLYRVAGTGSSNAIEIAETSFVGVGTTTKLPGSVYIIKLNESEIQLARTAAEALSFVPTPIDITSVGIGTSHSFTSKKQNSKVVVAIDNVIQSPIVSTAITASLAKAVTTTENVLVFSGITSFFGTDLIQIDDEIMRIQSIGVGGTFNVRVRRSWMGTGLAGHGTDAKITKIGGNYNIIDSTINFVDPPYGQTPLSTSTNKPSERDWTGITTGSKFQGRSFMRSGVQGSDEESYTKNYIFDDISESFDGQTRKFTLTSAGSSLSEIAENNAIITINDIFQGPGLTRDYTLISDETVGITSIQFTGTASSVGYDVNNASIPVGGIIVSVGSTFGFGLQDLVSAGGTAVVSAAGTIASISIGNSGSGYRAGIQTVVNVGLYTSSTGTYSITNIGTAAVSNGHIVSVAITNPGTGYTSSNVPYVVFDDPLSYSDIPLVYSSQSTPGVGTQAKINVVVGAASSVIDFELTNLGYGYGNGEILTIETGGLAGIPTDPTKPSSEFQITIQEVFNDRFAGWSIGQLQIIDDVSSQFNGSDVIFPIRVAGDLISIRSARGSNINVEATLLVFVNDVLQVPGEGYFFPGGSLIEFSEPPKAGDTAKILFYKGSGDVDVVDRDIVETVKVGDDLTINYNPDIGQTLIFQEEERTVTQIKSIDFVGTNPYFGPGNTNNSKMLRPVTWCKQTEDKIIDEKEVGKDRDQYEANIFPAAYVTQTVGTGVTIVYVDTLRTLFNAANENNASLLFQKKINILSQDSCTSAAATATVSSAGTVTSFTISDGGSGFASIPSVTLSNPVGTGSTASATATILNGSVVSIAVSNPGSGYASTNPPKVLIQDQSSVLETDEVQSFSGDYGTIVGFGLSTTGLTTKVIFDLFIPTDSDLRGTHYVSSASTISGISTGDYFVVRDSNIGLAVTHFETRRTNSTKIGICKSHFDGIYQVNNFHVTYKPVAGVGTVSVVRVFCNVAGIGSSSLTNITGIGSIGLGVTSIGGNIDFTPVAISTSAATFDSTSVTFDSTLYSFDNQGNVSSLDFSGNVLDSAFFGRYSWGKIVVEGRTSTNEFSAYNDNGVIGINTSSLVTREKYLKYKNYIN